MASKITGVGKFVRRLNLRNPAIREEVSLAIQKGAFKIQADAVDSLLSGPKTGAIYIKGKNRDIMHQSSAPGEAPASDTGNLARNIRIELSGDKLRADIGVHSLLFTPYARALELGTDDMEPRPYMQPALKKNISSIRRAVTIALNKGIKL